MMIRQIGLAMVVIVAIALPAAAKGARDLDLKPFEADWKACEAQMTAGKDNWVGWHRDFGGGYADNFEFYDGSFDDMASALLVTRYIDAIAREDTVWCYRGDGSLSMINVTMLSPNMAAGGDTGPLIQRKGRLYFDAEGHNLAIRGWITDADGNTVGPIGSSDYQLARGCNEVDLRLSTDDPRRQYVSVLGDIDGSHPAYTPNELDWCAVAEEGP